MSAQNDVVATTDCAFAASLTRDLLAMAAKLPSFG
jgi:hypothetical protein